MDWHSQIALDSGQTYASDAPVDERLVFLRKTYLLVLISLGFAALGGWLGATTLLPMVLKMSQGLLGIVIMMGLLFGGVYAVNALRHKTGINYVALFAFAAFLGLMTGPLLFIATLVAGGQPTIIVQAIAITGTAITGLSGYVLMTKKDFSFLRGALAIGLFALIGVLLVSMFFGGFQGRTIQIVISGFGALLFCGFILYDTSQIVRRHPVTDHVGAAIALFIDFFLLFIYVLRLLVILAASRD
jgi:FtsH-binding integral membrane protein